MPMVSPRRRNEPCPCGSGLRYKQCCGALQSDVDRDFRSALALERAGRVAEAAQHLARVLRADRHHLAAANRFSDILINLGQREAAVKCLSDAAGQNPNGVAGWLALARAHGLEEQSADAEAALLAAARLEPDNAEVWRMLGTVYTTTGDVAAARRAVNKALSIAADNPAALADAVRLSRITPDDQSILTRIEMVLASNALTPHQRLRLEFARGKAYDDLDDPARAMAAYDAANQIAAASAPFDPVDCARQVEQIIAAFPSQRFIDGRTGGGRAVVIVGMPRSGTTLMEQILSSHPAVAAGGELRFWGIWGPR